MRFHVLRFKLARFGRAEPQPVVNTNVIQHLKQPLGINALQREVITVLCFRKCPDMASHAWR